MALFRKGTTRESCGSRDPSHVSFGVTYHP